MHAPQSTLQKWIISLIFTYRGILTDGANERLSRAIDTYFEITHKLL